MLEAIFTFKTNNGSVVKSCSDSTTMKSGPIRGQCWRLFPGEHIIGVALTAVLVAVSGVLSSLDVLRNKPLATLRAE